jgi:hypothetical protein
VGAEAGGDKLPARSATGAPFAEKALEHGGAFVLPDAAGDLAAVIELRMLEQVH